MRKESGVTMTSLTVYVIVATIVIAILAFININFIKDTNSLNQGANVMNEYVKFYMFFIADLKSSDNILEYTESMVRFPNGHTYEIEKLEGKEIYDVYRDSVRICGGFSDINISYDYTDRMIEVGMKLEKGATTFENQQSFVIGRGY